MKYVSEEYHPKAATSAEPGQQIGEALNYIIILGKNGKSKYIKKGEPGFSDRYTETIPNFC